MILRLVKIYLVLSFLAVFVWMGAVARKTLDHNSQAAYCNYNVEKSEANYVVYDEPCRIRIGVLAHQFGLGFLIITGVLHSPTYLYLLVRYIRRRRRKI